MHLNLRVAILGDDFPPMTLCLNRLIRLQATITHLNACAVAANYSEQNPLMPYSYFRSLIRFSASARFR